MLKRGGLAAVMVLILTGLVMASCEKQKPAPPEGIPQEAVTAPVPAPAPTPTTATVPAPVYTCPMHPTVISDKPGQCPICGMNLVIKKEKAE